MGKTDSLRGCLQKQLIQSVLLKSSLSCIQCIHQRLIIIRPDYFHAVRRKHQCSRKSNITESYYVNHLCHPPDF